MEPSSRASRSRRRVRHAYAPRMPICMNESFASTGLERTRLLRGLGTQHVRLGGRWKLSSKSSTSLWATLRLCDVSRRRVTCDFHVRLLPLCIILKPFAFRVSILRPQTIPREPDRRLVRPLTSADSNGACTSAPLACAMLKTNFGCSLQSKLRCARRSAASTLEQHRASSSRAK